MLYSQINGAEGNAIPINDRSVLYGDALFETIAIQAGKPLLLEQHIARLAEGIERLNINLDFDLLIDEIAQTLSVSAVNDDNLVMRVTVTRGVSGRGYMPDNKVEATRIISLHEWPAFPDAWRTEGLRLSVSPIRLSEQPYLAGMKHANRLEQVLASQTIEEGCDDALMLDQENSVVCATKANVFALIGGIWVTHDLSQCGISGVMRNTIAEAIHSNFGKAIHNNVAKPSENDEVHFGFAALGLDDLFQAEEVFVCNSLMGVMPVRQIADHTFKTFTQTRAIYQHLQSVQACI